MSEGVHLDLARCAHGYTNASHGFGFVALERQRDQLKTQMFNTFCVDKLKCRGGWKEKSTMGYLSL